MKINLTVFLRFTKNQHIRGHDPKAKGLGKPIFGEGGLSVRGEGGSNFFSKQGGKGKAIFFA